MHEFHFETGYHMIDMCNDNWIFKAGKNKYHGSFKEVVAFAVKKYGFVCEEIDYAVQNMISNGHNCMHFGANATYLFSMNVEINFKEVG